MNEMFNLQYILNSTGTAHTPLRALAADHGGPGAVQDWMSFSWRVKSIPVASVLSQVMFLAARAFDHSLSLIRFAPLYPSSGTGRQPPSGSVLSRTVILVTR